MAERKWCGSVREQVEQEEEDGLRPDWQTFYETGKLEFHTSQAPSSSFDRQGFSPEVAEALVIEGF